MLLWISNQAMFLRWNKGCFTVVVIRLIMSVFESSLILNTALPEDLITEICQRELSGDIFSLSFKEFVEISAKRTNDEIDLGDW